MYERANGRFASTFLGRANVFSGRVVDDRFVVDGVSLPLPPGACTGDADYIVRPEKVEFAEHQALLRGRISARAFLGNHWLFQVETPLGTVQLTQANTGLPRANEGDEVGLYWAAESARVVAQQGRP
jgi:putative spermidine/putrescine transport system ATP-binding protein